MTNNAPNYCKLAEYRLAAYNDLAAKLNMDLAQLYEMKREIGRGEDDSVTQTGMMKKHAALQSQIADGMRELSRLDDAMRAVSGDYYAQIITLKYIERKSEEYIAELLNCDVSTVRRNKKRILKRMAVRLFGADVLAI